MIDGMIVEQFDNGITIIDGASDDSEAIAIVSLERNQNEDLGKILWQHIKAVMDTTPTNRVDIEIKIKPYNQKPQDNGI